MAKSRYELEENKKKKKAIEDAFKKANFQQTTQNLKTAAQSMQPKTNTTKTTAAKSSGSAAKQNTITQSAPTQQSGLSSFQKLANVPKTVQSVGQKVVQNANDMRNLQRNSIMWHGTTDAATRASLNQQNNAIRQRLGLSYDPSTGVTFDSKTGKNYSLPTQIFYGTSAGQRASTAGKFATSSTVLGQKSETQSGIDAHKTMADLYSRAAETWSDDDTRNRDNARQALDDEMQNILRQYGLQYSARSTGPNARFTVSDDEAIEKLRAAGADETTLAYVAENIQMREAADRLGQGIEAVWKRTVAALPALKETANQQSENVEQSRQNPEYVQLEERAQQLEAQLQSMNSQDADGKVPADYMAVYNEWQDVQNRLNELAVKTPVDQNKWGQTMLREAAEAQANATAGLAAVPRFLADTGISIAGNAPTMALSAVPVAGPALSATIMGASAAGQRAAELNAQGISPGEALGRGLTSGIVEGVTEKLPLDEMAKLLKGGGTSAVRNILRQMGIEASEESASYLMNYAADLAANDPNAEFSFAELAQNAFGGALSGGVFGTAGTVIGGTRTRQGPTVGIPESVSTQEVDTGARMAQEAMQTAQREIDQARNIAERFGAKLELNDTGFAGGKYENGVITINPNSSSPIRQVLVHELTHHIETSGGYNDLQSYALSAFSQEQGVTVDVLRNNIMKLYEQNGIMLNADGANRELTAAFCEYRLFQDEASIQRLAQTDITLFQRVRQWIQDAVARLRGTKEQRNILRLQQMYERAARTAGQKQGYSGAQYTIDDSRNKFSTLLAQRAYRNAVERGDIQEAENILKNRYLQKGYSENIDNRMLHSAPNGSDGYSVRFDDVSTMFGDDIYGSFAERYYGTGEDYDAKAIEVLQKAYNNPDSLITVYRAIPENIQDTALRNGDWITTVEEYARDHGERNLEGNYKIISETVPARFLYANGDSIFEFGFDNGMNEVYKNAIGNAKSTGITYDDFARLIPLSMRFDENNPDRRFTFALSPEQIAKQENSQALGRRLAELDAEKRQAETLLPGPIRDRAIQQAEEAMQRVQQEAAAQNPAPPARTEPSVQVPADAAFQYGLSPEAAMLEARERARNEAIKAAQQSSVGAAKYNFDPFSRMTNEYGTIDQGEKPRAREVDVPKSTDGDDRVSLFARTAMEAGATPDEAIERFEQEVANGTFSHDVRKDKDSVNKARQTITEKGFDGAMEQWADVTSGRRSATKDDIVLAEILYAKAMQTGEIDTGMRLAAEIAAEGTRAGQSVQAIRLLKRTTPEGKLYYIKKTVDNVQKDLNKKYGDKAPQIEINEQLALDLLAAKTDQDAQKAMDAIYTDVAAKIPATLGDRLNAWRYFAMLGNPRTHIRNVIGNIVYQIPTRASNKLSAGLQKVFIKDKDKRTRSLIRSGKIKEFAKQDYQTMQDVLDGNQYTSEMSEIQRRKKSFPKPIQAVMDANSKALDWEDQIFKRMTYVNSMTEFLTARRVDVDNISQDMLEQARTHAIKDAQRATFQDASALADFIGKIEKKNKASEIIIGGLVPFKRTPINIAKRGFELSPAGLLKGLTYDLVQVKKGNMTATDAIDHISTGLTGTSLAALGAFLASQGLLSASSPENDKERNFDVAQGSQEYALNIGPYSYTIDWAAPAALPMFVGAEFYNAIAERGGDEEQAFKQATDALSRLFEPMINMTMLSGISGTLQSVGYSQTNPIFAIAENIGENYAGQFVPTLLGQVARTFDGTRRTTYADKDSWVPDSLQTFLQRQANKIPGLSQNQPAYTDVWGREERSDNVVLRAFENFISPGYISEQVSTEAENALRDLYDETGEAAILPSKPQKYYKKDGKNVYLDAEKYAKLTGEKGTLALDAINALVQSSAYQSMTNDERVSAIKDIYDYSSALAANKVYGKELEGTIKTVQESGIEPGLYYAYKELQDTLSETYESYEARDEVFQTIRSDDSLTNQQKNQLYHTLLIKGTSESQWEKYVDISGTVTAEEYIDAMIQSQAIKAYGDELDEDRATKEATEFSRYLDMKQYDSAKRAALEDTFKFYNMFPAEPQNYTFEMLSKNGSKDEQANIAAIQNSGVTAAQYLTIKTLAGEAEYEKGVSGAKLAAQAAIVAQNTQNYDQYAAIMHALGYKKIEDAYTGAGTLPAATESGSQVSRQVESATQYINPVPTGWAGGDQSGFGPREAPTAGASTWHKALDIPANGGDPVVSIQDGTVTSAGWVDGYGWTVHIDHGNGVETEYHHMQAQSDVKPGDKVKKGQQIGAVGSTGTSTGNHLDFQVWQDGKIIDPLIIIPGYGKAPSGYVYDGTVSASTTSSGSSKSSSGGSSSKSTSNSLKKLKTPKQSWGGLDSLF